jgi:hypothetical protein
LLLEAPVDGVVVEGVVVEGVVVVVVEVEPDAALAIAAPPPPITAAIPSVTSVRRNRFMTVHLLSVFEKHSRAVNRRQLGNSGAAHRQLGYSPPRAQRSTSTT